LDLSTFRVTKSLLSRVNHIEAVNIQSIHVAQVVNTFMSAACPINAVAAFRNAGINLAITDDKLVCRITPESARCLVRPVNTEMESPGGETESDGEQMELQVFLEAVVTGSDGRQEKQNSELTS
jgi:hypothetical protein